MLFMLGSEPASTITFKPSQAGIMLKAYPFCSASSVFPQNVVTKQAMTTKY